MDTEVTLEFPLERKAFEIGRQGEITGVKAVLCSDGERRTAMGTEQEVAGHWPLPGWNRVYGIRIWDYNRNERVVVWGILRVTQDRDYIFVSLPDGEFQLPKWTRPILDEAHGWVVDKLGNVQPGFLDDPEYGLSM